jgi:hypothetical protein
MKRHNAFHIEGHVSAGIQSCARCVCGEFLRAVRVGGVCCVYYRDEKVVDLWDGVPSKLTGEPSGLALRKVLYAII